MAEPIRKRAVSWFSVISGLLFLIAGAPIAYGGAVLIALGGSFYYLPAGLILMVSGVLLILLRRAGAWLFLGLYLATWIWAVWEVGLDFWPLSPRIIAPSVFAILACLSLALLARARESGSIERERTLGLAGAAAIGLLLVLFAVGTLRPHNATYGAPRAFPAAPAQPTGNGDWSAYGRTNEGRRFAPFTQITKDNVARLQIAWTARTGDVPGIGAADENTPLQIGDKIIGCSPHDIVHALDAETGKVLWSFNPKADSLRPRCRSVGYFRTGDTGNRVKKPQGTACRERVVMATIDARLIEIDLATGMPCADFGKGGSVDLRQGLGLVNTNYYFVTSAPTVAGGLIIVGGTVMDSADVDVPSGVVRAFDARTGERRWFWDLGQVKDPNALPTDDAIFTPGTPNVWAPPSVDERFGLVFLPTGNPSPDHWGGKRSAAMEKYGSSVVALDLATGKERWSFQTVHHDVWDYDVASQPTVYDMPDGKGGRVPGLIVATKRGQIFVLDRRTGVPIARVEERSVPGGGAAGDRLSATQPYSVGMPAIGGDALSEGKMWGFSPFDQLWCRIAYRKLRNDGNFTPPGTQGSLDYPGTYGGMNWGGVSVDERNDLLIINDIRVPQIMALVPRAVADRDSKKVILSRFGAGELQPGHGGLMLQKGTPFAALYFNFMSPLGIPCQAPPFGTLTAIDLKTRQIAWQIPMGTSQDTGPLGIPMGAQMPIGMPTIGGSLVTGSGLIFFAGTQDFYLRAIDSGTGREVWKARMPIGAGATPMTYISPRSGRQFIVIAASGARDSPVKGDYVIAYALPR